MALVNLTQTERINMRSALAEKFITEEIRHGGVDRINQVRSDEQTGVAACFDLADYMLLRYATADEDYEAFTDLVKEILGEAPVPADISKLN
jgi:hypothetical protein